jgi:hypothetical protein
MVDDGSTDSELFGTLRQPRGGKHGYIGVRGGQGKHHNRYQAYESVGSKKRTVPGLFGSPHDAAVALAHWKQQQQLGLADEPAAKRPRKLRSPKAAEHPAGELVVASLSQLSSPPMQLIQSATALALPPATRNNSNCCAAALRARVSGLCEARVTFPVLPSSPGTPTCLT